MAEEQHVKGEHEEVEVHDRGLFDFTHHKNKEEEQKNQDDFISSGVEKIHLNEQENKHEGLLEKLHRSGSSSSSSSDEEEEVNGEKKKKKRSLGDKLKEKLGTDEKKEDEAVAHGQGTEVSVKNTEESAILEATQEKENKSFFEKIKEKVLPSPKKSAYDADEFATPPPTPASIDHNYNPDKDEQSNNGESKGIFAKILEKLPSYNKSE